MYMLHTQPFSEHLTSAQGEQTSGCTISAVIQSEHPVPTQQVLA